MINDHDDDNNDDFDNNENWLADLNKSSFLPPCPRLRPVPQLVNLWGQVEKTVVTFGPSEDKIL